MATATAKPALPTDEEVHGAISSLKMISDTTRLKTLFLLEQRDLNVAGLCDALSITQPVISHHLALLKVAGIVETRRAGKNVFYSLSQLGEFAVNTARKLMNDVIN